MSLTGPHRFAPGKSADENASHAAAGKHARALAKRIKAHPAYTVALGNLLGIEGAEDTTPLFLKATRATGSRTARNRPVTQGAVCIREDYD